MLNRDLLSDETILMINELQDQNTPPDCYVSITNNPTTNEEFPIVYCDFSIPFGLKSTAEITQGDCDDFIGMASSEIQYGDWVSAVYYPEVTEEEKQMRIFNHTYCARFDVVQEINENGDVASVFEKRSVLELSYYHDAGIVIDYTMTNNTASTKPPSDRYSVFQGVNRSSPFLECSGFDSYYTA